MNWREKARALYAGAGIGRVLMDEEIARRVHLPDGIVLDVGGRGNPSYMERLDRPAACRLIVLDLMPDTTVDIVGSVTHLPIASGACDAVLCFNVLEHVFDHALALAELRRVLKRSGTLYGRVPFLLGVHDDPADYWRFTVETLRLLLAQAGFERIVIVPHGGLFIVLANLLLPTQRLAWLRVAATGVAILLNRLLSGIIGEERNRERFPAGYFFIASSLTG